ncbi:MAG: hypothetical protein ACE5FK_10035, partial [Candidatus Methylomirabilia bacterium]
MTQNDLLREIASLAEAFSQLGARVSKAAKELQEPGVPPPEKLVAEFTTSRKEFADLRARAFELIESAASSPPPHITSLKDLESLVRSVDEAEKKRVAAEETRKRALMILDGVLALTHDDQRDYPPLQECQAKARGLHRAISEARWADLPLDSKALAEGKHPLTVLLTLVEHLEDLEDGQWEQLRDTVGQAFGKSLAVAASRGKLTIQTGPVPGGPKRRQEPERAGTALRRQREEGVELTDDANVGEPPASELEIIETKGNASTAPEPVRPPVVQETEPVELRANASTDPGLTLDLDLGSGPVEVKGKAEVKGNAAHSAPIEQI